MSVLRNLCCISVLFTLQGTIDGHKHSYQLDDYHIFVTGKPMLVCGNTAAMVGEGGHSWLAKHFQAKTHCMNCACSCI